MVVINDMIAQPRQADVIIGHATGGVVEGFFCHCGKIALNGMLDVR